MSDPEHKHNQAMVTFVVHLMRCFLLLQNLNILIFTMWKDFYVHFVCALQAGINDIWNNCCYRGNLWRENGAKL